MNHKLLQEFMVSLMKLKGDIKFLFGKPFINASIICHLLLLLMIKSCVCMEEFQKTCKVLTKLKQSPSQLMSLMKVLSPIYCGMILKKKLKIGKKTREDAVRYSARSN